MEKVIAEPPETLTPTGEFAGAVSVPKKPVTLEAAGCPASQMSDVPGTTTVVSACAVEAEIPITIAVQTVDLPSNRAIE